MRSRWSDVLALAILGTLLLVPISGHCCPKCFASTEKSVLHAYYWSALLLTTTPLGMVSLLVAWLFFRKRSLRRSEQTQGLNHPGRQRRRIADFLALTKLRLVLMILVTTLAGFYLGSRGAVDGVQLLETLVGVALAASGAMALNQYLECDVDARMKRTRRRPLPDGRLAPKEALIFGAIVTGAGVLYLMIAVNVLSGIITATIVGSYLFVYTPLKKRTPLSSIVGAVPGALPSVSGWVAAAGKLPVDAWPLFFIIFFWQIPHNMAIAWLFRDDYIQAGVRVFSVVHPDGKSTAQQCVMNSLALLGVSLLPAVQGLAGWTYLFGALALGLAFVTCGVRFSILRSTRAARQLLFASYVYLPGLLGIMVLDNMLL